MQRDMLGYGKNGSFFTWPNNKKIAISFVINYEEGAENSPLYGDKFAETYGAEFLVNTKPEGVRNLSIESIFEYGSRAGIWRLVRLFDKYAIPLTFFATGKSLEQNPEFCHYLKDSKHEVAGHGYRWIDYANVKMQQEKEDIIKCVSQIQELTKKKVVGWYTGRRSQNTRDLLMEIGGFYYDSDSYADDLPYFINKHLVIPYNLVNNDFRYCTTPGFATSDDFFKSLKNTFDYLCIEDRVSLMNVGLHARISGHPGRAMAVLKFLEYIKDKENVWLVSREELAKNILNLR